MSKTLNLEKLSCGHVKPLLSDISTTVKPGEIIALLGANGVGKSTLLKTLVGLISPLEGKIKWNDINLVDLGPRQRAQVMSFVSFGPALSAGLRVMDVLRMATYSHSYTNEKIITEAIELFRLGEYKATPLSTLSDGERQRVFLAQSFVQDTPLILLDEPLGHLDVITKLEVLNLFKLLSQKGKIIIFSTHEWELLETLKYRIWALLKKESFVDTDYEQLHEQKLVDELYPSRSLQYNYQVRSFETK